jgi:hypothetical protein
MIAGLPVTLKARRIPNAGFTAAIPVPAPLQKFSQGFRSPDYQCGWGCYFDIRQSSRSRHIAKHLIDYADICISYYDTFNT